MCVVGSTARHGAGFASPSAGMPRMQSTPCSSARLASGTSGARCAGPLGGAPSLAPHPRGAAGGAWGRVGRAAARAAPGGPRAATQPAAPAADAACAAAPPPPAGVAGGRGVWKGRGMGWVAAGVGRGGVAGATCPAHPSRPHYLALLAQLQIVPDRRSSHIYCLIVTSVPTPPGSAGAAPRNRWP
jgi:hypothetical protein